MRTVLLGIFLYVFFISPIASVVYARTTDERISTFDVRMTVYRNANVDVAERIVYDFGDGVDGSGSERHGIFRTISYSYQAGTTTYTANITNVLVNDETGTPVPFNESRTGGELTLTIGDPKRTVSGVQSYVITYTVHAPFLYFDEYDELYWNITGSWEVPIDKASVLVDFPKGEKVISATCYKGRAGSTDTCDTDKRLVNAEQAGYTATAQALLPREGFSIAVIFPKGVISHAEKPWSTGSGTTVYAGIALPMVTFLVLAHLWYVRGRDIRKKKCVPLVSEPPRDISPTIASVIYNETITAHIIPVTTLSLATQGALRIHPCVQKDGDVPTDYILVCNSNVSPRYTEETRFHDMLCDNTLQEEMETTQGMVRGTLLSRVCKSDMYQDFVNIVHDSVLEHKYFIEDPYTRRRQYTLFGAIVLFGALSVYHFFSAPTALVTGIGVMSVLFLLWGMYMPAKTRRGARVQKQLEGFRRHMLHAVRGEKVDTDKHATCSATMFETYAPYACALNEGERFAVYCASVRNISPSWWVGESDSYTPARWMEECAQFITTVVVMCNAHTRDSGGEGTERDGNEAHAASTQKEKDTS